MSTIDVIAVSTPAELDRFIELPVRLYKADANYVPPLMLERREALSPAKNPYFQHATTQFWLARRDGRDVGRISAQIDSLVTDPDVGHFGMIAAEDDAEVFSALFAAAEGWLAARGKRRVLGPFNLSINEETGLLIDGFDTPPVMMMGHDPSYAARRVEALGYAKAKDLIAYLYDIEHELPAAARRKGPQATLAPPPPAAKSDTAGPEALGTLRKQEACSVIFKMTRVLSETWRSMLEICFCIFHQESTYGPMCVWPR